MSRSIHSSRPKFRKAFKFNYSNLEERIRVLGKIIDEIRLKRTIKRNAQFKKQAETAGLKPRRVYVEPHLVASESSFPSMEATQMAQDWNEKGYG